MSLSYPKQSWLGCRAIHRSSQTGLHTMAGYLQSARQPWTLGDPAIMLQYPNPGILLCWPPLGAGVPATTSRPHVAAAPFTQHRTECGMICVVGSLIPLAVSY